MPAAPVLPVARIFPWEKETWIVSKQPKYSSPLSLLPPLSFAIHTVCHYTPTLVYLLFLQQPYSLKSLFARNPYSFLHCPYQEVSPVLFQPKPWLSWEL